MSARPIITHATLRRLVHAEAKRLGITRQQIGTEGLDALSVEIDRLVRRVIDAAAGHRIRESDVTAAQSVGACGFGTNSRRKGAF